MPQEEQEAKLTCPGDLVRISISLTLPKKGVTPSEKTGWDDLGPTRTAPVSAGAVLRLSEEHGSSYSHSCNRGCNRGEDYR